MEERMLKVSQVAKRLGVTPPTVRRMLESNRLLGVQISPTTWRVSEAILEAFIAKQGKVSSEPQNVPENGGEAVRNYA